MTYLAKIEQSHEEGRKEGREEGRAEGIQDCLNVLNDLGIAPEILKQVESMTQKKA